MTPSAWAASNIIRRLWPIDRDAVRAHFMRLDHEARRMRFAGTISDAGVQEYVGGVIGAGNLVVGCFIDGELRAVAELRGLQRTLPASGELAFSVEREWQHAGIGDTLFDHLLAVARNRGFRVLHMTCLSDNVGMRHLAAKYDVHLKTVDGEVDGMLKPAWPTAFTMAQEFVRENQGVQHAARTWLNRVRASS